VKCEPTVTVVMTSFNYARFLRRAVESVVQQTWDDWRMIIVDDCSTDGSWAVIEQWRQKDARITAIRNPSRLGFVGALNRGVREARSEFVAILDSDDSWLPERLEKQLALMHGPDGERIGVCGTHCLLVDEADAVLGKKEYPLSDAACRRAWWYRNPFCHSATLIRTACFDQFGWYDERFPMAQDLELWFRFGQGYRFRNLPDYCVEYRISGENASRRRQRRLIRSTIAARRWAASEYGDSMNLPRRKSGVIVSNKHQ
jgi:glycosyltransferase involved in cell wall biosynthesis